MSDGSRKVIKISEVTGMEGEAIMMQDLLEFVHTGTAREGTVEGHFQSTGIRSTYAQRIERAGYKLGPTLRTGTG
jgi:pilus assembly protein CpaF